MPLPTGDVIGILADNLRLRKSVLPLSRSNATRWTQGLDLPRGGQTVLYTGLTYQLVPYIQGLVKMEQRLGDSPLAGWTGFGRRVNRVVNVSSFLARPQAAERAIYNQIPINVAMLLKWAGIEFGCLFEDDLYSGALAYDLGLDEVVAEHAKRVHSVFKKYGVREVITIDPHTTYMLREVYPALLPGYDVQVRSYLEVLAKKELVPSRLLTSEVTLHDSCVFARYENVVEEPRALLRGAGVVIKEPENTGRQTWCCGGPVESLYPEKALANARKRVAQLREAANEAVVMCPMCLVNLEGAADATMSFRDISYYLCEAYVPSR